MRVSKLVAFSLAAATAWFAIVAAKSVKGTYAPKIDPANFQTTIDNPYCPLIPGTILTYVEKSGGSESQDSITVTSDTRVIMGVTCVVVRDRVSEKGRLKEDTFDWYAQDRQGNVWYFGEDTKEFLPGGRVKTEGSWQAGAEKAWPGIMMPAHPTPGTPAYRQEYGPGHAEDMGQIVAIHDSTTTPYGRFTDCVRTKEWSLLEAGTDKKWYAKGIGFVREVMADHGTAELVSVKHP